MKTKQWLDRHRIGLTAVSMIVIFLLAIVLTAQGKSVAVGVIVLAGVLYLATYRNIRGLEIPEMYFTLFIWGDVDPSLEGPFKTAEERDAKSLEIRRREGPDEGGIYKLDVDQHGIPQVRPYYGGFLDDADNTDAAETETSTPQRDFLNHYDCPFCGHKWHSVWSAMCDDTCPECHARNISPVSSEELPA